MRSIVLLIASLVLLFGCSAAISEPKVTNSPGQTEAEQQKPDRIILGKPQPSDQSHFCEYTETILGGSTHSLVGVDVSKLNTRYPSNRLDGYYSYSGIVPPLDEVNCPRAPLEITSRALSRSRTDSNGNRLWWIELEVAVHSDLTARVDIGGLGFDCHDSWHGLYIFTDRYLRKGDTKHFKCAHLADVTYDAPTILEAIIDDAVVCRVVFLDKATDRGRYRSAWYNHSEPTCDNLLAIDTTIMCSSIDGLYHPFYREDGTCKDGDPLHG